MICAFIMFINCFVKAFGGKGFIHDEDSLGVAGVLEVASLDILFITFMALRK